MGRGMNTPSQASRGAPTAAKCSPLTSPILCPPLISIPSPLIQRRLQQQTRRDPQGFFAGGDEGLSAGLPLGHEWTASGLLAAGAI